MNLNQKKVFSFNQVKNSDNSLESNYNASANPFYKNNPWIIVGFDPGVTVGIAILDLSGNILSLVSFKEISRAEVIKHIITYGKALIIASDVFPTPKSVKKLATALNSKIYSPSRLLTVESKKELVDSFVQLNSSEILIDNAHERDALAAAIKTYKHYEKKLEQIEKKTRGMDLDQEKMDHIKSEVIMGTPISKAINRVLKDINDLNILEEEKKAQKDDLDYGGRIKNKNIVNSLENNGFLSFSSSIQQSDENKDSEIILKLKKRIKAQEKQIKKQEEIIKTLKDEKKTSRNQIKKNQNELSKIKSKMEKLHYEYSKDILLKKELSSKVELIKKLINQYNREKTRRKKLEENLQSLQKIKDMEISKNSLPVKIVRSFTKEGIKEASDYWKIKKGDIVLLTSSKGGGSSTAALLADIGIKAVIIFDKMSHPAREVFEQETIPIINADKLELKLVDEFAIVKDETLTNEIEKWNRKIKEQKTKEQEKILLTVIDEYRAKRKRKPSD